MFNVKGSIDFKDKFVAIKMHFGEAGNLAYLRPIPNLTICSPLNEHELRRMMYTAQLPEKGTFIIRYPRGCGELQDWYCPLEEITIGTGRQLHEGTDIAVLSIGPIGNHVTRAIEELENEGSKLSITTVHRLLRHQTRSASLYSTTL